MGYEKHQLEVREEVWRHVALNNNWRCSMCSMFSPLCDKETFFRTGMCGYCFHILQKDI